jgi:hypothetical protein
MSVTSSLDLITTVKSFMMQASDVEMMLHHAHGMVCLQFILPAYD